MDLHRNADLAKTAALAKIGEAGIDTRPEEEKKKIGERRSGLLPPHPVWIDVQILQSRDSRQPEHCFCPLLLHTMSPMC